MDLESLRTELKNNGQEKVLKYWDILNDEQKELLYSDLKVKKTLVWKQTAGHNKLSYRKISFYWHFILLVSRMFILPSMIKIMNLYYKPILFKTDVSAISNPFKES